MSTTHGSFFADAAATTAWLYESCGNDSTLTVYVCWLALKSLTIWLTTPSSASLPPLCVQSVTVPSPDPPDDPPLLQAARASMPATATLAAVRRRVVMATVSSMSLMDR